jgi:hypothetical protein
MCQDGGLSDRVPAGRTFIASLGARETGIAVNAPPRKRACHRRVRGPKLGSSVSLMLFVMGPQISLCAATQVSQEEGR